MKNQLFVALVGPDGCGKTTIADGIVSQFDKKPFVEILRIHSNFSNTIRLREIKRKICLIFGREIVFRDDPVPGTRGIGMQKPLSVWRSMFYIFFYGMQLAMGRSIMKRMKAPSLVLADRYYYDYYYMRGHMNSPMWWKRLVGLLVKKPDLVFFLDRPADEIYAQKPELDVAEIKRQQAVIRNVLRRDRRARCVDASKGVLETIRLVNLEISNWIEEQGV